jgi:hypothetical protein
MGWFTRKGVVCRKWGFSGLTSTRDGSENSGLAGAPGVVWCREATCPRKKVRRSDVIAREREDVTMKIK